MSVNDILRWILFARMAQHPSEYRWSSYGVNSQGETSSLLEPHSLYKELVRRGKERQQAYRQLFRYELDHVEIDTIRKATNGNFSLEDNRFKTEISKMLGRRVTPGKAGRPKKIETNVVCPQITKETTFKCRKCNKWIKGYCDFSLSDDVEYHLVAIKRISGPS